MTGQRNPNYRERVYKIVRRIPRGRVMTYGQIAELAEHAAVDFEQRVADLGDPAG